MPHAEFVERTNRRCGILLNYPYKWLDYPRDITPQIREIRVDYPSFTLTIPYPGTELFAISKEKGYIRTEDWNEYTTTRRNPNQLPVMRTDELDYKELLDLYNYTLRQLAKIKFKKNPTKFVIDQLVKIRNFSDLKKMSKKVIKLILS